MIIHGGAPATDGYAGAWANLHGIEERVYRANWGKYGRAAGPIRNQQMLNEAKPHLVVSFPGGRGTQNMIDAARAAGVKVMEMVRIDPLYDEVFTFEEYAERYERQKQKQLVQEMHKLR